MLPNLPEFCVSSWDAEIREIGLGDFLKSTVVCDLRAAGFSACGICILWFIQNFPYPSGQLLHIERFLNKGISA
jgi:hypothetical protein